MQIDWMFCGGSISSGSGIRWMTNVSVSFAVKFINGRQIQIADGTQGNGPLRLSCPTERCNSIPMDWVLVTDELVALAETATSEEHNLASPRVADRGEEHGLHRDYANSRFVSS